ELDRSRIQTPLALDPDIKRPVDHDFCDAVVCEEPLEWAVAEDVVGELSRDPVAIVAGKSALLREVPANVGDHALAQDLRVGGDVEELRPEVADDPKVHRILQRSERV